MNVFSAFVLDLLLHDSTAGPPKNQPLPDSGPQTKAQQQARHVLLVAFVARLAVGRLFAVGPVIRSTSQPTGNWNWKLKAGSWELGAGHWELVAGSWEETGHRRQILLCQSSVMWRQSDISGWRGGHA